MTRAALVIRPLSIFISLGEVDDLFNALGYEGTVLYSVYLLSHFCRVLQ